MRLCGEGRAIHTAGWVLVRLVCVCVCAGLRVQCGLTVPLTARARVCVCVCEREVRWFLGPRGHASREREREVRWFLGPGACFTRTINEVEGRGRSEGRTRGRVPLTKAVGTIYSSWLPTVRTHAMMRACVPACFVPYSSLSATCSGDFNIRDPEPGPRPFAEPLFSLQPLLRILFLSQRALC